MILRAAAFALAGAIVAAAQNPVDPKTYVIGPNDVLSIAVFHQPDLTRTAAVRPDGKITMPLIGDVQAAGLTPVRLNNQLSAALGNFIRNPDVTTTLLAVNSKHAATAFDALQFLVGDWTGEGAGAPGQGVGECSFTFDLQHKVLIRKSFAQYPNSRHDDLMVIYLEPDLKAIYFDTEGHVIHYTVEAGPDSVRFVSEQFRLTYKKADDDKIAMDFEIAAPGKPLSNYLHAMLRRK